MSETGSSVTNCMCCWELFTNFVVNSWLWLAFLKQTIKYSYASLVHQSSSICCMYIRSWIKCIHLRFNVPVRQIRFRLVRVGCTVDREGEWGRVLLDKETQSHTFAWSYDFKQEDHGPMYMLSTQINPHDVRRTKSGTHTLDVRKVSLLLTWDGFLPASKVHSSKPGSKLRLFVFLGLNVS